MSHPCWHGGDEATRRTIEGYNRDDCLSTRSLRNWLEQQRGALVEAGHKIDRPAVSDGAPPEAVGERQQRVAALIQDLIQDVPAHEKERTEKQNALWLLANLLDWHRRESKADWWEYFRLKNLPEEDLLYDKSGLGGLTWCGRLGLDGKLPVDRYSFPKQETEIRAGDAVLQRGDKIGQVLAIDFADRMVDIKKTKKTIDTHPTAVFLDTRGPNWEALAESLFRLAIWVRNNGLDSCGAYRGARDLLLRRPPRIVGEGGQLIQRDEPALDAAKRLALALDHSVLAVQGPPGSGKTFTGARMICELVRGGKRVGVTAVSHRVIRNLLDGVLEAADEAGLNWLRCVQKVSEKPEEPPTERITLTTQNEDPLKALRDGTAQVAAGTAWLWSRDEYFEAVDVLVVDEAGQMSLANALAVAQAAKSIVLLGDPQQLDQPLRGSHPDGAEVSALEHMLAGAKTTPPDKGLFLEETWRLHPAICKFTSEVFYEARLQSRNGLERQRIEGHPWIGPAGLWFVPVNHEGNQNSSPEEVERVASIVDSLLEPNVVWINSVGGRRQVQREDILIVAPYNAQVSDLATRLRGARVGTVDKFQGQEAPVVIYSMATSSPEDAPRGMEFLYSLNRLNVATSRARVAVIVVGSPRLLEPECRSPRQMQLANALCRYAELASVVKTRMVAR